MIYLTNTIGLSAGIVGTLIAISKLFDGVTDIFFGSMIDKTRSKMSKARPWMLFGYIGLLVNTISVMSVKELSEEGLNENLYAVFSWAINIH